MRMTSLLVSLGLTLMAVSASAEVGVSITVGEPGFFGHIEIGDAPRPVLLAPGAVIIDPLPAAVVVEPLYLYVPVVHSSNWGRYCARYHACGRPVYFVQESWYRSVYVPHYHKHRVEYDRRYRDHYAHDDHSDHRRGKGDKKGGGHKRKDHGK